MIYMHLLKWVGFGLIGYVPNTLYNSDFKYLLFILFRSILDAKIFWLQFESKSNIVLDQY
jgi:hypothetical protein